MGTINKITGKKVKPVVIKEKTLTFEAENACEEFSTLEAAIEAEIDENSGFAINIINPILPKNWMAFNIEDLPYCCGINELGDLECDKNFPTDQLTKILDMYISNGSQKTSIINTNGNGSCIKYEIALAKCKNWTLVKTFKSPSSGNTIKMWISNNI